MATVQVRYIVHDATAAIAFYVERLGFRLDMHPAPAFAMLSRGDLRLVLSAPNPAGQGRPMPTAARSSRESLHRLRQHRQSRPLGGRQHGPQTGGVTRVTNTAVPTSAAGNPIGFSRVLRKEDVRFIRGHGNYVDDIHVARACCTEPCCAAPTRTPRSSRSTP